MTPIRENYVKETSLEKLLEAENNHFHSCAKNVKIVDLPGLGKVPVIKKMTKST
jgi:hypothetical protein